MIPRKERCQSIGTYHDESGQLAVHQCTRRKHEGRDHVVAIIGMGGPYPEHKNGVVFWDKVRAAAPGGGYEPFVLVRWTE